MGTSVFSFLSRVALISLAVFSLPSAASLRAADPRERRCARAVEEQLAVALLAEALAAPLGGQHREKFATVDGVVMNRERAGAAGPLGVGNCSASGYRTYVRFLRCSERGRPVLRNVFAVGLLVSV